MSRRRTLGGDPYPAARTGCAKAVDSRGRNAHPGRAGRPGGPWKRRAQKSPCAPADAWPILVPSSRIHMTLTPPPSARAGIEGGGFFGIFNRVASASGRILNLAVANVSMISRFAGGSSGSWGSAAAASVWARWPSGSGGPFCWPAPFRPRRQNRPGIDFRSALRADHLTARSNISAASDHAERLASSRPGGHGPTPVSPRGGHQPRGSECHDRIRHRSGYETLSSQGTESPSRFLRHRMRRMSVLHVTFLRGGEEPHPVVCGL